MTDFEKLFDSFSKIRVAVIGDLMLDTYWWGQVDRISPEAPVPVVGLQKKEFRIGGAGNVALNLRALKAQVTVFSVIGRDPEGTLLKELFTEQGIQINYLLESGKRITTNKTRVISMNQQMMRLDSETTEDLLAEEETRIVSAVEKYLDVQKPNVLIFEDYNKGVLTSKVISQVLALCQARNVFTTADPKKKNFFTYTGVGLFKPNLKEVREGLHLPLEDIHLTELEDIHHQLLEKLGHQISLITLSEKGLFCQEGKASRIIPSHVRRISDVSGAGDAVIAVASLVYAATQDIALMAEIANLAGGLVCEEVGTMPVNRQGLLKECQQLLA
jgi:rfaE bifunctional protein kinase chain/domain